MSLKLRVTWDDGAAATIAVERDFTVRQAKTAIEIELGVPVDEQRIFYQGTELRNSQTLNVMRPIRYKYDIMLVHELPDPRYWGREVKRDWTKLQEAPQIIKVNADVLLVAIEQAAEALELAGPELLEEPEFICQAIVRNPGALRFAPEDMRADRALVREALALSGMLLDCVAEPLKRDRETVLVAVRQCGCALAFAAPFLTADREVALAAVQQDGMALEFVGGNLQADGEIVKEAVKNNDAALKFAASELQVNGSTSKATERDRLEKAHSASKAYAWMGLSLPDAEEEQPKASKSQKHRSHKVEYIDDGNELGESDRLEIATHWRIEQLEEGDFLVHRWEKSIKLKALPRCAECTYGRYLWCKMCGPAAMSGASTSMKVIMEQIARKNPKKFDSAQQKAIALLGSGLYWTDLDLRKTSFLGVE